MAFFSIFWPFFDLQRCTDTRILSNTSMMALMFYQMENFMIFQWHILNKSTRICDFFHHSLALFWFTKMHRHQDLSNTSMMALMFCQMENFMIFQWLNLYKKEQYSHLKAKKESKNRAFVICEFCFKNWVN